MKNNRFDKVKKLIKGASPERLNQYLQMYDRLLLHHLAMKSMSEEEKEASIDLWSDCIKSSIDYECSKRTEFLESTKDGRMAKYRQEPDGEDLRLLFNSTYKVALNIINQSLLGNKDIGNFLDEDEEDDDDNEENKSN